MQQTQNGPRWRGPYRLHTFSFPSSFFFPFLSFVFLAAERLKTLTQKTTQKRKRKKALLFPGAYAERIGRGCRHKRERIKSNQITDQNMLFFCFFTLESVLRKKTEKKTYQSNGTLANRGINWVCKNGRASGGIRVGSSPIVCKKEKRKRGKRRKRERERKRTSG